MKAHALAPYLDPDARDAELEALCARLDVAPVRYGESVEGRPLVAVELVGPRAELPTVMLTANIHGPEWIGNRTAHAFLRALVDDERGRALRARAHVRVLPCLNPDGYARTFAREGQGTMRELRWNAHGVDLNRNFPLPHGRAPSSWPGAGSRHVGDATYRGPHALSEPECAALAAYLEGVDVTASASLHSFMGTLMIPPVLTPEDARGYQTLGAAFRRGQVRRPYTVVSFPRLDVFTGELEDHQHHAHRTWAVCVECFSLADTFAQHVRAPSIFWRMNPRDPAPIVDDVLGGLFAYYDAALALARPTVTPAA